MSRAGRKGQRQSASTWRKRDKAYRERERERRRVNAVRRAEVAAAAEAGVPVEVWRALEDDDG